MQDRVERSIDINAPLERVWHLVSEPGWWVGGPVVGRAAREPGAVTLRDHPECGVFPVEVVDLRPMEYVSFRWASQFPGDAHLHRARTTLIEFTLHPSADSVRVTVVESGFTTIDTTAEDRASAYRLNSSGWEEMLTVLVERAHTIPA